MENESKRNREKYQSRDGLEGPFQTKSVKVVYYDPKEGSYYDPDTDMYMLDQIDNVPEGLVRGPRSLLPSPQKIVKTAVILSNI